MKVIIKRIILTFFNDSQILQFRKWLIKLVSFKKNIYANCSVMKFSLKGKDVYFGYYDISPFSKDDKQIIFLAKPKVGSDAEVAIGNVLTGEIQIITKTRVSNWQQGARLRWFAGSENSVLFNDFKDNAYISKIFNICSGSAKTINWPLYDVDLKGKYGLTINFARLGVLRPGYGYTNTKYIQSEDLANEGIRLINIKTNLCEKIIKYSDIAIQMNCSHKDFSNFYINHLSFSPNGEKFLFFWIEIKPSNIHKASLLVYNMSSEEIIPLETELSVSHYTWIDDNRIIATAYDGKRKCRYYSYGLNGNRSVYLPEVLLEDGHPTLLKENLLLTDTYPDKIGFQKLLLINTKTKSIKNLVKIYSTYKYSGEMRCDLHPRISNSNNLICFDANVSGNRAVYIINKKL